MIIRFKPLALFVVCLLFSHTLFAADSTAAATVIHVWDGDSLVISSPSGPLQIRLYGIDAPEKEQAYADESRHFLQSLLLNQEVYIEAITHDNYQRIIAKVMLRKQDIAELLLTRGLAWAYRYYSPPQHYLDAEQNARRQHLGLWQDEAPTPPWQWRQLQKKAKASGLPSLR